jgi:hypothetical protein
VTWAGALRGAGRGALILPRGAGCGALASAPQRTCQPRGESRRGLDPAVPGADGAARREARREPVGDQDNAGMTPFAAPPASRGPGRAPRSRLPWGGETGGRQGKREGKQEAGSWTRARVGPAAAAVGREMATAAVPSGSGKGSGGGGGQGGKG